MSDWLIYAALGALVGFIAGLLGVGGGAMIVPVLLIVFGLHDFPPQHTMHCALATSLACITFSSALSLREHHRRGAVNWSVFRGLTPGLVAGTVVGSFLATRLGTNTLKLIFAFFLYYVALQMLIDRKPHAARELPGAVGYLAVGAVIGFFSALIGVGGAALSIPFMLWSNVSMRDAIGTSSALGFPIASVGALAYTVSGWQVSAIPSPHLGYIYLPALLGITAVSLMFVPLGVRASHRLPIAKLKRIWAAFLFVLASQMLYSVFR